MDNYCLTCYVICLEFSSVSVTHKMKCVHSLCVCQQKTNSPKECCIGKYLESVWVIANALCAHIVACRIWDSICYA